MLKLFWPVRVEDGAFLNSGNLFGARPEVYAQFDLLGHNGLDMVAARGTKIYASHDGWIIEQTSKETGYGLRITQRVEADGKYYMLIYGHMERLEKPEDITWNWNSKSYPVKAGQVIGYVDSTGFSTGDHLHFGLFEMDSNGNRLNYNNGYFGAINPAPLMAGELEKPYMNQFKTQNYKGELRIVLQASNWAEWESLCRIYGVDPNKQDEQIV